MSSFAPCILIWAKNEAEKNLYTYTFIIRNFTLLITLSNQYAYPAHCSQYICWGADKENLFNNKEPL